GGKDTSESDPGGVADGNHCGLGYAVGKKGRKPRTINSLSVAAKSGRSPGGRGPQSRVLRIIGGSMRGRRLRFPDTPEIRPTPDRVRETLFNWIGARVAGARCLDAFAGSGALGLEALSRGAAYVRFIEHRAPAAQQLRRLLTEWKIPNARVEQADTLRMLEGPAESFGLVFLDPPFGTDLLAPAAARLEERSWLAPGALVYVESAARAGTPPVP